MEEKGLAPMSNSNRSGVFWGVLLIVLGLGFLLHNFDLVSQGIFNLWPLLVIGAGIWMFGETLARRRGGGLVGASIVLGLGLFWLLENFEKVNDRMFLPILLISIGVGLMLRALYDAALK